MSLVGKSKLTLAFHDSSCFPVFSVPLKAFSQANLWKNIGIDQPRSPPSSEITKNLEIEGNSKACLKTDQVHLQGPIPNSSLIYQKPGKAMTLAILLNIEIKTV